jgi:hypothetical protein
MRIVPLGVVILFFAGAVFAGGIRKFDVSTLEKLGNELSYRDEIAGRATRLVLERNPEWENVTPQWWISDLHPDGDMVYLIAETKAEPVASYKVTLAKKGAARVEDIHGQAFARSDFPAIQGAAISGQSSGFEIVRSAIQL